MSLDSEFPPNNPQAKVIRKERTQKVERIETSAGRPEKKIEKVVTAEPIIRKKSRTRRFFGAFAGDDAKSVGYFVMRQVLIPALQEMVVDAGREALERSVFGSEGRSGRGSYNRRRGDDRYVSYSRMSTDRRKEERPQLSRRARSNFEFDEIILATRYDGEEVLDRLESVIQKYEAATVSDLYEMLGVSGNFTDEKYGWTTIAGATVRRQRGGEGYVLDLPRPELLD